MELLISKIGRVSEALRLPVQPQRVCLCSEHREGPDSHPVRVCAPRHRPGGTASTTASRRYTASSPSDSPLPKYLHNVSLHWFYGSGVGGWNAKLAPRLHLVTRRHSPHMSSWLGELGTVNTSRRPTQRTSVFRSHKEQRDVTCSLSGTTLHAIYYSAALRASLGTRRHDLSSSERILRARSRRKLSS